MTFTRKKHPLFAVFYTLSALLMLTSCNDLNPQHTLPYLLRDNTQQKIADGISGRYTGSLTVAHVGFRADGQLDELRAQKLNTSSYMVGGHYNPFVVINNFPISLISRVTNDTNLATLFASQPSATLTFPYTIMPDGFESHTGSIETTLTPYTFTVTDAAGTSHAITLSFNKKSSVDGINADDTTTWSLPSINLKLQSISVDGRIVQEFSTPNSGQPSFIVVYKGEKQ